MSTKSSDPTAARKKLLLARISSAQKQADAAKKTTKLAKLVLRQAKRKLKEAKHSAKGLRKAVKKLTAEFKAMAGKKSARKPSVRKSEAKRARPVAAPVSVSTMIPAIAVDLPPGSPAAQ
jgi:chromosome segregation ATPase